MATDDWIKKSLKIQQETEKAEAFQAGVMNALMMIGKAHPPGELPPYVPPDKPSSPWEPGKSPAPSRQKLASTQIRPNQIMLPFVPKDAETDDMYGEGVDEVELKGLQAHGEGRGPQPKYHDEYNRPLKFPPWMHINPRGEQIEIPWQKKEYLEKHPELMISQGPDYIGDKRTYGKLDRILNPLNDFKRPTLDQLRIHAANYPKA